MPSFRFNARNLSRTYSKQKEETGQYSEPGEADTLIVKGQVLIRLLSRILLDESFFATSSYAVNDLSLKKKKRYCTSYNLRPDF